MATARNSTRKTKTARRFDAVDLGNQKAYTPVRDEFGNMEYELMYAGQLIGYAYDAEGARERLNEYAYDMERGRVEAPSAAQLATLASDEADAVAAPAVTVTYNAELEATEYTSGAVTLYDQDGDGLACLSAFGTAFDILYSPTRLDDLRALWQLLNHPAIQARLGLRTSPPVRMTREVCDDEIDARYGTEIATLFVCGDGDSKAELEFSDPSDNPYNVPTLYALGGDGFTPELVERALPNIIAVLSDPRVRQRRGA